MRHRIRSLSRSKDSHPSSGSSSRMAKAGVDKREMKPSGCARQLTRTHRTSTEPTAWFRIRLNFRRRFTARQAHRWCGRIAAEYGRWAIFLEHRMKITAIVLGSYTVLYQYRLVQLPSVQ